MIFWRRLTLKNKSLHFLKKALLTTCNIFSLSLKDSCLLYSMVSQYSGFFSQLPASTCLSSLDNPSNLTGGYTNTISGALHFRVSYVRSSPRLLPLPLLPSLFLTPSFFPSFSLFYNSSSQLADSTCWLDDSRYTAWKLVSNHFHSSVIILDLDPIGMMKSI